MRKIFDIKFILIIISVFFFLNLDVKAIDFTCQYKNDNNVLELSMSGEYGTSMSEYPVSYSLSINGATPIKFHPANFICYSNDQYERFGGVGYFSEESSGYLYACPKELKVAWKDNYFVYKRVLWQYNNINGKDEYATMPVIFFSETGYKIENNKIVQISYAVPQLDKPIMKGLSENDYTTKTFSIDFENSSSEEVEVPPTEEETGKLQYCYYKNNCNAVIELKFYKNANINERIFNDGRKLMNWENYNTCPNSISITDEKYYGNSSSCTGSGSVKNCYDYIGSYSSKQSLISEGKCEDISDNANETVIRYVGYNNPNSPYVKITKSDNLYEFALVRGASTKKLTGISVGMFANSFASDNSESYPRYLNCMDDIEKSTGTSASSCTFSNKKEANAKKTYMYVGYMGTIANLGEEITIKTCEDLVGGTFVNFLKNNVVKVIYIGIPILLIILTSFDFAKVVFIDDKEGIQGAAKKFGKRAIIAILIYLIPTILIFLTNIFASNEVKMCVEAFKSEVESSN